MSKAPIQPRDLIDTIFELDAFPGSSHTLRISAQHGRVDYKSDFLSHFVSNLPKNG
eukprot:UN07212